MEQKTFLAIVLSFIFLLSYNALFIDPQQKKTLANSTQITDNKQVIDISVIKELSQVPNEAVSTDLAGDINAPESILENDNFSFAFSEKSGSIKSVTAKAYAYTSILTGLIDLPRTANLESFKQDSQSERFLYNDQGLQITRTFKAIDRNTIKVTVNYKNISNLSILKNVQFNLFNIDVHGIKSDANKMRDNPLFEYSVFLNNKIVRKGNAFKFSNKENKSDQASIEWAGWRDRYHFTIVRPDFKSSGYSVNAIDDHKLALSVNADELKLEPGASKAFDFTIFVGPQDMALLKSLDGNLHKIMAFSGFAILDYIEMFIYHTLLFMNKFVPNWGLCIILISVLIYGATYPLTMKSMMSMRKMQEIQPKMVELREKYKNNPQKLNAEVVQLYKVHNVNPLSGCLPVLLQMPVFISLYQVLWRTHNFQGAKFLWIKDLSEPDRLFTLSTSLPFLGNQINILPFLMMIVMFFQQKITAKNMVITDPAQEMQQKMMMFVMPVFIGAIFYHFASGLTLYFTVFYLLSTLSQYKMSKLNAVK